jgi:hypothetical protein
MDNKILKSGIPLPAPKQAGVNVSESLLAELGRMGASDAVALINERVKYGMKKYGQPLMSDDGRDSVVDALQEAGDLLQYIWKAKMKKEDLSQLKYIIDIIAKILTSQN